MDSAGPQDRKTTRRFVTWTVIVSLVAALVVLQIPYVADLESSLADDCFKLMHGLAPHPSADPRIFFVSIDDNSVNPDYSPLSSPWGKGRWFTRGLWVSQLAQMERVFQPKVLAYDILFRPTPAPGNAAPDADTKVLNDLEARGNQEMLNELCDYADNRDAGLATPKLLFAFDFPESSGSNDRLLSNELARQVVWFAKLKRFSLPAGSVAPGAKMRVFDSVRLPMDAILQSPSYYLGPIDIPPDADGIYRRAPMVYAFRAPEDQEVSYMPGFALEAFLLWLGIEPEDLKPPGKGLPSLTVQPGRELTIQTDLDIWHIPIDRQLRMPIVPRFVFKSKEGKNGGPEMFRDSFVDLLERGSILMQEGENPHLLDDPAFKQKFDEARVVRREANGEILIVGDGVTGGTDMGNLPLEQEVPQSLVHIHALSNILQKDHVFAASVTVKVLVCLGLAALVGALYLFTPVRLASLTTFALILGYPVVVTALLIAHNIELPLMAPTFFALSCFAANSYRIYNSARQGREEMRRLFATSTSPRVLRLAEENPEAFYQHRKAKATILFSDVEGFTKLSEKLDPGFLALLMNRYLSPMTAIIVEQEGYLHQYMGDGIMAFWVAPLSEADHEYKACVAAWRQIESANALTEILPEGQTYHFHVRIGVNTGMVSAGIMGSDQKIQYSVIGDDVNLAARLEPANKDYGTQIIIGPQTYAAARGRILVRTLDKIIVKGRSEPVLIYELLGLVTNGTEPPGPWLAAYEKGLEHLWHREWDEAERLLAEADRLRGGDAASQLQRERVREYRLHPPPPHWQGEFTRLKKD